MVKLNFGNLFIKGETAAFEEVYRRYYSLLYSYGIRMVGDRELVADTIQNLFVKLILNCRNLHYTDNVKAYLLCSFRNKLLDAFQSLRPMEVIEECHEFFPMGEEIINSLFKKDDVDVKNERRLAKAISRLSGRQREILYLYYVKRIEPSGNIRYLRYESSIKQESFVAYIGTFA